MEKDQLSDFFKEFFEGYEAEVRPDLWSSVSSHLTKLSYGVRPPKIDSSVFIKIFVGIAITSIVSTIFFLFKEETDSNKINPKQKPQVYSPPHHSLPILIEEKDSQVNDFSVKKFGRTRYMREIEPLQEETKQTEFAKPANELIEPQLPIKPLSKEIDQSAEQEVKPTRIKNEEIEESEFTEEVLDDYYLGELPNVFTPNGDGINDFLLIDSKGLNDFSIVFLDQNNRVVYQTNDPLFNWDGIDFSGKTLDSGILIYFLTARTPLGKMISRQQVLKLQR